MPLLLLLIAAIAVICYVWWVKHQVHKKARHAQQEALDAKEELRKMLEPVCFSGQFQLTEEVCIIFVHFCLIQKTFCPMFSLAI